MSGQVNPNASAVDFATVLQAASQPVPDVTHQTQAASVNFRHDVLVEIMSAEESSFCSRLIYVLCTPFRWIGELFGMLRRCLGL